MSKIKILISTDSAGLSSGLAETCRHVFIPLLRMYPDKYEIHQLGFFHFNAREQVPWPIYPTKLKQGANGLEPDMEDRYGEKSFDEVVEKVQPDIVFAYGDMWHFMPTISSTLRNKYRLCVYYTIDGQPYYGHIDPEGSTHWGANLIRTDQIVVLSEFGRETLKRSCPELKDKDIKVMYHALDLGRYPRITKEQKQALRESMLPAIIAKEGFICGFIGRNQFRKQNYKLWELAHYIIYGDYIECGDCGRITMKEWDHSARKTRDISELTLYDQDYDYTTCWHCKSSNIRAGTPISNFYLWMHTPKNDSGYNFELHQKIWEVSQNCIYTGDTANPISKEDLAKVIASFDMFYHPSGGEGFNNPGFECLAAGIPIVYSNYSSHAEFSKYGGLPVRVANYTPEIIHGIMRSAVDTNHAIEQTLKLIRDPALRESLSESGRNFASMYSLGNLAPLWDSIFTEMMQSPLPVNSNLLHPSVV